MLEKILTIRRKWKTLNRAFARTHGCHHLAKQQTSHPYSLNQKDVAAKIKPENFQIGSPKRLKIFDLSCFF